MKEFYDYYGNYDYADKWVMGAILGEYVNMKNRGDADFKNMNQKDTRVQAMRLLWPPPRDHDDAPDEMALLLTLLILISLPHRRARVTQL